MSASGGAPAARSGCRFCGAAGALLHGGLRDRLFGVPGEWRHLRCETCDHVWLEPRPADPAALYVDYYTHGGRGGAEPAPAEVEPPAALSSPRAWIKRGAAARLGYADRVRDPVERLVGHTVARLRPLHEAGLVACMGLTGEARGELLDVGCGDGTLLVHLRALGWRVSGVEPDPRAAAVAAARIGARRVVTGELAEADFGERRFDAIVLSHVVEHLPRPEATLARCRALLAPRGRLALATPNPHGEGARRFGADWVHWDPPRHLEVYSPRSLRRLVEDAGFRVRSLATPCTGAVFAWLASGLLERDGRLDGVRIDGAGVRQWAGALLGLAREWRAVARGDERGEEILLVAEAADGASRRERTAA